MTIYNFNVFQFGFNTINNVNQNPISMRVLDNDPIFDDESAGSGQTVDLSQQVLASDIGVAQVGQVVQSVYQWNVINNTTGQLGQAYLIRIYNGTDPANPGGQDGDYYQAYSMNVRFGDSLTYSNANFVGQVPYSSLYQTPQNIAPVAIADTLGATEDKAVTFTAAQLLSNDTDVDSPAATLRIAAVTSGTGGNAVLNGNGSVTFTPISNFNGPASFSYTVSDGTAVSNAATVTVNVAAINDAPVLDLNGAGAGLSGSLAYVENQGLAAIAPLATVSDVDSPNFNGGLLNIGFDTGSSPADQLTVINQGTGAGQIGVAGNTITYSGSVIGTFNGGVNGGNLVVFFTSDAATPAAVQALTRAIAFTNNSDSPSQTPRQLLVVLGDGDGNANGGSDSTIVSEIITVQAINDAPVLDLNGAGAGLSGSLAYVENQGLAAIAPLATVSDVDSPNFNGGLLNIGFDTGSSPADQLTVINQGTGAGQIGVAGNTITYSGSVIGTFNGGVNGGNLVVFFTSDAATPAAVQALTRAIAFTNNSDSPSQTPRQLLVVLGDGDGNANGGSDSTIVSEIITVQAINDAPVLDLNGAGAGLSGSLAYVENQGLAAIAPLATVSDVDSPNFNGGLLNIGFDTG